MIDMKGQLVIFTSFMIQIIIYCFHLCCLSANSQATCGVQCLECLFTIRFACRSFLYNKINDMLYSLANGNLHT